MKRVGKSIDTVANDLLEIIKDLPTYKEYIRQQENVKNDQEVLSKINEIRLLNLALSTIQNSEQAYDEQEKLEKRFDELSEDTRVYDFIEAENVFLAQYQEIYRRIMDHIQFV